MAGLLNTLTTYYVTVTLSANQIASLRETPVMLISAPTTANQAVLPFAATVWYTGTSPYTAGGEFIAWFGATQPTYTNGVPYTVVMPMNQVATAMQYGTNLMASCSWGINRATAATNQPVYVGLNGSAASNWTGGSGSLTMVVALHLIVGSF